MGCCDQCGYWWDDWKYFLACIAIVVGIVLFAVLLAAYAFVRHIDVAVEDASLTRFDLLTSPVTALAYNLTVTLTIHNPNWAMSLKNTKPLDAVYKFDNQQFDRALLADKGAKHPPRKTRVYHLVVGSNSSFVALGNAGEAKYRKEKPTGTFQVDVVVTGEVRYTARYTKCKIEATCPLKLQLAPPGAQQAVVFQKVKCTLADAEKNC